MSKKREITGKEKIQLGLLLGGMALGISLFIYYAVNLFNS